MVQLVAVVPTREASSRQAIRSVCDRFDESEMGARLRSECAPSAPAVLCGGAGAGAGVRAPSYRASWCRQLFALSVRAWQSTVREPMLVRVRLLQTLMVSLLVGVIFWGQRLDADGVMNMNGALFLFLTNMTFQNVFAVINVFCGELRVFVRESRSRLYRTDAYFLGKTLAETPLFVAIPVLFTCVCYYMIGLNGERFRFVTAIGVVTLVANVSTSFGYLVSCASPSVNVALSVGPPVIIPFLLFGGFFLNVGSTPVYLRWLASMSWFRYGNEALLVNQWSGVDHIDCPPTPANLICPPNGRVVLEALNFNQVQFYKFIDWFSK